MHAMHGGKGIDLPCQAGHDDTITRARKERMNEWQRCSRIDLLSTFTALPSFLAKHLAAYERVRPSVRGLADPCLRSIYKLCQFRPRLFINGCMEAPFSFSSSSRVYAPGCSLHCEHFMANTLTPSFHCGIIWIFVMFLFNVFDYFWPKKTNLWTHFDFFCQFLPTPMNLQDSV